MTNIASSKKAILVDRFINLVEKGILVLNHQINRKSILDIESGREIHAEIGFDVHLT